MRGSKLGLWAFLVVLGAGGCSASNDKSSGTDVMGSAGDAVGMAGDGSGTTTGSGGSSAGDATGSGGSTGTAGASSTGGATGVGGAAVVGAGGTATGSGGSVVMGNCNMMAGAATGPACATTSVPSAPMIDDMELIHDAQDGQPHGNTDNNIPGHWFVSGDGTGGTWIAPANKWNGYYNTKLDPPRGTSQQAMFFGGQGFTGWGVALGIGITPVCVDASPYSGITFWAKSTTGMPLPVKFDVVTYDIAPSTGGGGCTGTCTGKYETNVTIPVEWGEIKVPFCSFATSGTQVPLQKNKIQNLTFLIGPKITYQFYIDDISFY